MKKFLKKIFGGLKMSWTTVIIFAIVMGVYTALMAMFVPDGNSFHDIAVTPEWWVLPAILIITNCKKPLEAALKTFVFFLISQPLVYLIQVPFNSMGWGLFGYYPYWFKITLLTFPGAFIGWFIKKDEWYSGVILAVMTAMLALVGIGYINNGLVEHFPNHLISVIYCFGISIVFIFGIFEKWQPRAITAGLTIAAGVIYTLLINPIGVKPYETYRNAWAEENGIELVGEPYVSHWAGEGEGHVDVIDSGEMGYVLKLSGSTGRRYEFTIADESENEYNFEYYFDDERQTVILEKK